MNFVFLRKIACCLVPVFVLATLPANALAQSQGDPNCQVLKKGDKCGFSLVTAWQICPNCPNMLFVLERTFPGQIMVCAPATGSGHTGCNNEGTEVFETKQRYECTYDNGVCSTKPVGPPQPSGTPPCKSATISAFPCQAGQQQ